MKPMQKTIKPADEIAAMATRGEDVSKFFTNNLAG